jgi:hypothetical protein
VTDHPGSVITTASIVSAWSQTKLVRSHIGDYVERPSGIHGPKPSPCLRNKPTYTDEI